ncbi:MAG: ComF family protein [Calditrichota bacterium]
MIALSHPRTWPIWDLLFPPLCAVCERPMDRNAILYCDQCWADAPIADMRDLHQLKYVDSTIAGFRYAADDVVKASVQALKYEGMRRVSQAMVRRLLMRIPPRFMEANLVWSPVPLHWQRQLTRGYNQSAVLGRDLARLTGHDLPHLLLRRIRNTPTQTARSYKERSANVRNAFVVRKDAVIPERVLLIDDVITTGATMDECARILKNAGVQWVGALSFALSHH